MTQVGSFAMSVSVAGGAPQPQQQNPAQQQLQQMMQFMTGMLVGRIVAQALQSGGQQQGCPCSQQTPNFGQMGGQMPFGAPGLATPGFGAMPGMTPGFAAPGLATGAMPFDLNGAAPGLASSGFQATPFPSLATGGFMPNMGASNSLMAGLPSLGIGGSAAMQAAQMQMLHSDQQQAMTIGTIGGGFPSGYMGLPGSFSTGINNFLG